MSRVTELKTLDEVRTAAARLYEVAEILRRDWYERTLDSMVCTEYRLELLGLSVSIALATGAAPQYNAGPTPTQIKASPELRRIVRERREKSFLTS